MYLLPNFKDTCFLELCISGVSVEPGLIELAVTLCCDHSTAIALVSAIIPALPAAYAAILGTWLWAEAEAMFIILPPPCLIISPATACPHKNGPFKFYFVFPHRP